MSLPTIITPGRLAVLDRGSSARRLLRALRELTQVGQAWVPVALPAPHELGARHVREAAEVHPLRGPLAAALRAARVDAAWVGPLPRAERLAAAEACAAAGIPLVGASLEAQRASGERAPLPAGARRLEVVVVRDLHGGCWTFEPTLLTARPGGAPLAESPAPETEPFAATARTLATQACAALRWTGVGAVHLAAFPDGLLSVLGVGAPRGTAAVEASAGAGIDLVRLQLAVFTGQRLTGPSPRPQSVALATALHALDRTPRTLALLRLPSSPGVRCDAAAEEGDDVAADGPLVTLVARGADRAEASTRLTQALLDTDLILHGGGADKAAALAALDPTALHRHPEVALVLAALEAYAESLELECGRFLADARRGLPRVGPAEGLTIELRLEGRLHPLRVQQVGPQDFRVASGAAPPVAVHLERAGRFERLVTLGGRRWRALLDLDGLEQTVELGGVSYAVQRDPTGVVGSPSPAVVVSIEVRPGDVVEAGAPLARVESMKLQAVVSAPWAGVVREVLVVPNAQVDAGAPLVRLEPAGGAAWSRPGTPLALPRDPAADAVPPSTRWFADLRRLLLGFDVDAGEARELARTAREVSGALAPDEEVLAQETWALTWFADLQQLFARFPGPDLEAVPRAPLEELWRLLHEPAVRGAGMAPLFRAQLQAALAHYGTSLEEPAAELDLALLRLWKAHQRAPAQLAPLLAILERHVQTPPAHTPPGWRDLLDRLATLSQGRFPALADLAREARYRLFDQPALRPVLDAAYASAEADLAALLTAPPAAQGPLMGRLVGFRFPLSTRLLEAMSTAGASTHRVVEVLLRRYYRLRTLELVTPFHEDGVHGASTWYARPDARVRLLCCHARPDQLPAALATLARLGAQTPPEQPLVVEVYAFDDGTLKSGDALSAQLLSLLEGAGFTRPVRRASFVIGRGGRGLGQASQEQVTFRRQESRFAEDPRFRGVHPRLFERLQLGRLERFTLERLPAGEDIYLYRAVARTNPKDERLFACAEVRDVSAVHDERGRVVSLPHLERVVLEALAGMRLVQARRPADQRLEWNRVLLSVIPELHLSRQEIRGLAERLAPAAEGLGLEMVLISARVPDDATGEVRETLVRVLSLEPGNVRVRIDAPTDRPLEPMAALQQRIVQLRRRGLTHPAEVVRMLAPLPGSQPEVPPGKFEEHDLDEQGGLVPVHRPPGQNTANVVVGLVRNFTDRYPEGMLRVVILGDGSRETGSVAEPECRRIIAALDLAERLQVPVEWFALSAGAKISTESGTENMDWVSRALRRIIEFTQAGGELNVVVCGINVGAQPYWNAEATMLMHTRGILVMVPGSAMVLTGKQALEYSGAVSAADNDGIGGYARIMGPNGQAQYQATSLPDAIKVLLEHHRHCYRAPGERFPRKATTQDPVDRDVRDFPHGPSGGAGFATIGEVFSEARNPGRNQPFDIRRVMAAAVDQDHPPLERWRDLRGGETAVVWDAHLGGQPVCLIGIESRPILRSGFVPVDGPHQWTAGTLFPQSSRKVARAVNAASGGRPLVVLANLSGFDGSPESMRQRQLEYGAEIGRAVVNFKGPVVFCVVSRYHGGAFVVFSRTLREEIEVVALEGARASVIGGAPAAAVVFAREVEARTRKDARVVEAEAAAKRGVAGRARLEEVLAQVRSEKLGEVGAEFDAIHTVERARQVGSVDRIISVKDLRPWLVEAVARGMARTLEREKAEAAKRG